MAARQIVIFGVNNQDFGVDINQVNIIERPMEIFKIPNTPDYIAGLINLRGKVHTVFDLRKRFGLEPKAFDESTKFIIANLNSSVIGFIVDEVKEIIHIEEENIENTPSILEGLDRKFISGIAKSGDKVIMLLDLEETLSGR